MQKILSKIIIFLGVISFIVGVFTAFIGTPSYASDIEITGKAIGLEVSPSDTKMFDLGNLNPGDIKDAKIDIKNKYTEAFEVFIRAERSSPKPGEGEADLFDQLVLTIYLDGIEIHSGPIKGFAIDNKSLGNFPQNSVKELRAVVHLPGSATGNEFQDKSLEVKWYFIAELNPIKPPYNPPYNPPGGGTTVVINPIIPVDPQEEFEEVEEETDEEIPKENLPKTGQIPANIYYVLGSTFIFLGFMTRKKDES